MRLLHPRPLILISSLVIILLSQVGFAQNNPTSASATEIPIESPGFTVRLSPDGQTIAIFEDANLIGDAMHEEYLRILLLDVQTGAIETLRGMTDYVADAAFSPDSRSLVSLQRNGDLIQWDLKTGSIREIWHTGSLGGGLLAFLPDGRLLTMVPGQRTSFLVWDLTEGAITDIRGRYFATFLEAQELLSGIQSFDLRYISFALAPDGTEWVTASAMDAIDTYSLSSDTFTRLQAANEDAPRLSYFQIAYAPDSSTIYAGNRFTGAIEVLNAVTGEKDREIPAGRDVIFGLSPDGSQIAWMVSVGENTGIFLADSSGENVVQLAALPEGSRLLPTARLYFSPDATRIIAGGLLTGDEGISSLYTITL